MILRPVAELINPMHVHLDALGGVAGDMFAAALVDARPALAEAVDEALAALDAPPGVSHEFRAHDDGVLAGRRFVVAGPAPAHATPASELFRILDASRLPEPVRARARAMLRAVAEAEAAVHDLPPDRVMFHELGGWDTPIDFVAAAAAVEALGPCGWSCGPLPRGRGTVETAHGALPLPAPAALRLLKGFVLIDDGLDGERITPTGAAILRHLAPSQAPDRTPRRLVAAGHGFGARALRGRSNALRASLYAGAGPGERIGADGAARDRVAELAFDIDDQTPEDLAAALDRLRAAPGALDVAQHPLVGKNGRLAARVEILARPEHADALARLCFSETATLGLRLRSVERLVLRRETARIDGPGGPVRVKTAARPGGRRTAKAEIADVRAVAGHAERAERRRAAEERALAEESHDDAD